MLDDSGFDLWADSYDASVGQSDADSTYPFAGYRQVLGHIYRQIRAQAEARSVLDLGFGTGLLSARLYADGYGVTGVDFSPRMLALAQPKMPGARLICHDFSAGLPQGLGRFDAIVSTYALHHLTDEGKIRLLCELLEHLTPGGHIWIGDVAFETRSALERCRAQSGDSWDDEEIYFVVDELRRALPVSVVFEPCSFCSGVLTLSRAESPNARALGREA